MEGVPTQIPPCPPPAHHTGHAITDRPVTSSLELTLSRRITVAYSALRYNSEHQVILDSDGPGEEYNSSWTVMCYMVQGQNSSLPTCQDNLLR